MLLQRGLLGLVAAALLLSPTLHLHPEGGLVGHGEHAGVLHSQETHPQAPAHVEAFEADTDADCASCLHRSQRLVGGDSERLFAELVREPRRTRRAGPPTAPVLDAVASPRGPPATPIV